MIVKALYITLESINDIDQRIIMTYRIETTDPITGKSLDQLVDMPFVIENEDDDKLIIYFESEENRDLYLEDPTEHQLEHYAEHSGKLSN
jgi:hypothetical protein